MAQIRKMWEPVIAKRRQSHPKLTTIMVELSEDESGILSRIEYWREKDSILGSCGWRSDNHKCNDHFHPVIGDSWDNLVSIMRNAVPSSYVRVIMVNPLVDWLSPMCLLMNATCNKFDHVPHVLDQWTRTEEVFQKELQPLGCNLTGRGSDGDGRRYKLQHELFTRHQKRLQQLRRAVQVIQRRWRRHPFFSLVMLVIRRVIRRIPRPPPLAVADTVFTLPVSLEGAKGFTFAAEARYVGKTMVGISGLSTQDPKHKGKRLDMPLQSAAKTLIVGDHIASATDLFLVRQYFENEQVRNLRTSDLRRDDRQNFAAVVRRSGKLVIGILELLQQGNGSRRAHQTQGTVAVYKMLSKYLLIFFSVKLSLADRVELAGYVSHFLRLWHVSIRCWPDKTERNVNDNFYSMQTFRHVLMSCQSAVMFIMACSFLTPCQVCGLRFVGSDCCEVLFSIWGGWGILSSWQRNFSFRNALRKCEDSNALMSMRARGNVKQQTHRSVKAGEFDNRLHEDMNLPDADLTIYPSTTSMVVRWNADVTAAASDCEQLGMKHAHVPDSVWVQPWKMDPKNPPVPGYDEYLRRKHCGDDDDADSDAPDDRDEPDDGDEPDDDPFVTQAQLDYALENIGAAVVQHQTSSQQTTDSPPTKRHMIRTPSGKFISKETAICMLREAFDTDGKISKDRLRRIVQCAQRSQQDVACLVDHDGDSLELHKDIALAFDPGDGGDYQLWFGRVQKMVIVSATGRRTLKLMSIPVSNMPEGLSVMCTYYSKVPRRPRVYRYGSRQLETSLYHTTSVLCVVHFDYNHNDDTYTLSREQWTHVREELKRLQNTNT